MEKNISDILMDICAGIQSSVKYDKSILKNGGKEARIALDDYKYRNLDPDGYRMTQFKKSAVIKDEYTGKKITMVPELMNNKVTEANTDHIIPLKTNNKKYNNKAFVKAEDERNAFNKDYNLAMTDASLNKSKGDKSNTEFIVDKLREGKIDEKTAITMISKEIIAEKEIEKSIKNSQIKNASIDFMDSAKNNLIDNSLEYAWILMSDIVQVGKGNKSKEEVVREAKEIAKRVLSSSGTQLAGSYITQKSPEAISDVIHKMSDHPQVISTLSGIAVIFANNILECRKGIIDVDECEDRIANDVIYFFADIAGGHAGVAIGEYLVTKLPSKVAGKLAGVTVSGMGFVTKAIIEVAITTAERYIDNETEKSRATEEQMKYKYNEVKKYCAKLSVKSQMISCAKLLKNTLDIYEAESAIENGITYYDIDSFLKGINSINNIYGTGLTYNSSDFFEFCDVITLLTGGVKGERI